MSTITIPKKITKGTDLVVLPRKDYERLLEKQVPEFTPTLSIRKGLTRARRNLARGKYLTVDEIRQKLGFTN